MRSSSRAWTRRRASLRPSASCARSRLPSTRTGCRSRSPRSCGRRARATSARSCARATPGKSSSGAPELTRRLPLAAALAAALALAYGVASAAPPPPPRLPPLREQDQIRQDWLKLRLERVLPALMRRHGVSMWLVVSREYNEDPAFFSLVSPSVMHARRRTILVFYDRGPEKGVERLTLGGGSNGGLYEVYRDPEGENRELWGQGQWALLRKLVAERKPATIAVDVSHTHAFSDGLSAGEKEALEGALGPWTAKLVRAENLPLEYVGIRVPEMLPQYRQMMQIVHALIARA